MFNVWSSLSGQAKASIEGAVAAVLVGIADFVIQAVPNGLSTLNWQQVMVAGLVAGCIYVRGNLAGLMRYPDGSTTYIAPQGSAVLKPDGSTTVVPAPGVAPATPPK